MWHSLYARLAVVFAAILAVIGIVYTALTFTMAKRDLQQISQSLNRDLAKNIVAERNLVQEDRLDRKALQDTFKLYMDINPSIEIYLIDRDGTILSYSADPQRVKRQRVSLAPVRDFLHGGTFPLLGDDPRSPERQKIFSVTPVPSAQAPEGYLYVILRGEQYDMAEQMIREQQFMRLSVWIVAASLMLGLMIGLFVFYVLTRRLRALSALMSDFRDSDFQTRTRFLGGNAPRDEIDELGVTFDQMASRIQAQLQSLQAQDAKRRELIANISHDLRTPLSTLHGYLETMQLKAGHLEEDVRAQYLGQALEHSNRLHRLIGELFDLARLDAAEVQPQGEVFSLAELAQDVVQQFEPLARQRNIDLKVIAGRRLPFVFADIAMIQRVLENLVSNALRHTGPGEVGIKLDQAGSELRVAVSDDGRGIPAEDIPRIFERFYQVDDAHRGSGQAGLGLAIVKRILDLHGRDISVESQVAHGTTFRFTLPLVSGR